MLVLVSTFAVSYNYEEMNDITFEKKNIEIIDFFTNIGLSSLFVLVLFFRQSTGKILHYTLHLVYLIAALKVVMTGSRIAVIGPMIIYIYIFLHHIKLRRKVIVIVPLVILCYIIVLFMPYLSQLRSNTVSSSQMTESVQKTDWDIILIEAITKTNWVYYSVFLCEYDGMGEAGIAPYTNSVLSFVPRFMYKERPVPISKDGTFLGTPSRVAANMIVDSSDIFNVNVTDSAISLWHGKIYAYIFNIIFSAFLLVFIVNLVNSGKFFSLFIGMLFVKIPIVVIYYTFDCFLRDFPRYLVIYFVFYVILHFLYTNKILGFDDNK